MFYNSKSLLLFYKLYQKNIFINLSSNKTQYLNIKYMRKYSKITALELVSFS